MVLDLEVSSTDLQTHVDSVDCDKHLRPLFRVVLIQRIWRLEQLAIFLTSRQHDARGACIEERRDVVVLIGGIESQKLFGAVEGIADFYRSDR